MIDTQQLASVKKILTEFIQGIDQDGTSVIIILDDDEKWLNDVKEEIGNNHNVIIISDIQQFRSFIISNKFSKLFIDVNLNEKNGIDLAEEMALNNGFADLVFISDELPSADDAIRIHKLGANYLEKSKALKLFKSKEV